MQTSDPSSVQDHAFSDVTDAHHCTGIFCCEGNSALGGSGPAWSSIGEPSIKTAANMATLSSSRSKKSPPGDNEAAWDTDLMYDLQGHAPSIAQVTDVLGYPHVATKTANGITDCADDGQCSIATMSDGLSRRSISESSALVANNSLAQLDGTHNAHSQGHRLIKQSSVGESLQSTASKDTLGSIGSLFLNRSIRSARLSACSLQQQPQDPLPFNMSRKETASSQEMPGPLCTEIDPELRHSSASVTARPLSWSIQGFSSYLGRRTYESCPAQYKPQKYKHDEQYALVTHILDGDAEAVTHDLSLGDVHPDFPGDCSQTPLFLVASRGSVEVVKVLLATNAVDVNRQDKYGATALSAAASNGHCAVVEDILETGKVGLSCDNGQLYSAMMHADLRGHEDVVALLRQWVPRDGYSNDCTE